MKVLRIIRLLLTAMILVGAIPQTANAQSFSSYIEHDWRVTIGGNSYGLVQEVLMPFGLRTTAICVGRHAFTTRLRAPSVAAFGLMLLAGAGLYFFTRLGREIES